MSVTNGALPRSRRTRTAAKESFAAPSPGEILRRAKLAATATATATEANQTVRDGNAVAGRVITADPFRDDIHATVRRDRGIMLAPLRLTWRYRVLTARPFAKWIRTKDMLLTDARLGLHDETAGIHYFGTYIAQDAVNASEPNGDTTAGPPMGVACETLWGFTDEAAMHHMFDLARDQVPRVSIVQFDLRDFVVGLKRHVRDAGPEHFKQEVWLSPTAV